MFGALKEIGEIALSSGEIEVERIKGKGTLLAKVIFDLEECKLDCDCGFTCDQERAKEYLWVGNAVGQKPQLVLTTDNAEYLLNPSKRNKWAINQIIYEIDRKRTEDCDLKELRSILNEIKEKFFREYKDRTQEFNEILANSGCHREDIALYTVCVRKDGKIKDLVKTPGYRKLLDYALYATESEDYPIIRGRCHICGDEKEVLTNPSYPEGTPLCIYNLDKAGFMPNLDRSAENLLRAHVVCIECKKKLRMGIRFVEHKLTATIGETSSTRMRVFLIPKVMGIQLSYEQLNNIFSKMKDAFNAAKAYKELEEIERNMKYFMEFESSSGAPSMYFLNLLFGDRVSSHFSFKYLIQDVPVMRLLELSRQMTKISNYAYLVFKEKWSIGFEDIFSIFPLQKTEKGVEWKPMIELLNSMISGTPYPKENLIFRAVLFARIHRYGVYGGYSLRPIKGNAENEWCRGILKYNLLVKLLMEIGSVEMEKESASDFRTHEENVESFLSNMGYSEWQKALFLLGMLVGRIGVEQYNKGDEKKAILNKINFEGMPAERVKLLAVNVIDGLRNYRVLDSYSEVIYANMKMMLDKNLDKLQNPIDNVFYILSGYAYATLQAMKSGGDRRNGK